MKRKIIAAAGAVTASAIMSFGVYAANISIVIDGNTVESDTAPQITAEGRTIVPLRVISEELGAKVDWNAETKSVSVEKSGSTLELTIGKKVMTNNGSEIKLDSPAQIVNNRTMVPLRAISESFGCNVDWESSTKTVVIDTKGEDAAKETAEAKEDVSKKADETKGNAEPKEETYKSKDGWSVKYNSALVNVNESDDEVSFVYTGESAGTNMIAVSYIKGKEPQEVLGEKTEDWSDENTIRNEGYFAGKNWAFFRDLQPAGGSGLYEGFTAAEYNDGVILIERIAHVGENEDDTDTIVSDTLAAILDSMEFDDFKPQKQYAYVPGVYTNTYTEEIGGTEVEITNTVTLNEDHTAVISLQDEVKGTWRSTDILLDDGQTSYEYTIEGDNLYLMIDDSTFDFSRDTAESEERKG